jgi:hypothetical protein
MKLAVRALLSRESVHPEHTVYDSFATLCATLARHGLLPEQVGFFSYRTVTRVARVGFHFAAKVAPATADGILLIATRRAE